MPDITLAQKARAEKRLNTQFRYSEGIMTEREFIHLAFERGWSPSISHWNTWKDGEQPAHVGYVVKEGDGISVEYFKGCLRLHS